MALTARKYNQPITLINAFTAEDDFGKGAVTLKEEALHTFAKVIQLSGNRARIENTNGKQIVMQFAIRYTDVAFNVVAYNGKEYTVVGTTNVDMGNRELIIEAQRAE